MLLTRLERENKNMDKEKLKFYSIIFIIRLNLRGG